ncbi:MAG TPA: hypothetical protein VIK74_07675 [Parasegetibacter sp.]|jgi:hypothetical protein
MILSERHSPLYNPTDIETTLKTINEEVNGIGFHYWIGTESEAGYEPSAQSENRLLILGHYDHAYAHIFELTFYEVLAHNVVDHEWQDQIDQFYLVVNQKEMQDALQQLGVELKDGFHVIGIKNFDPVQHNNFSMYVAAKGFSYLSPKLIHDR